MHPTRSISKLRRDCAPSLLWMISGSLIPAGPCIIDVVLGITPCSSWGAEGWIWAWAGMFVSISLGELQESRESTPSSTDRKTARSRLTTNGSPIPDSYMARRASKFDTEYRKPFGLDLDMVEVGKIERSAM